MTFWRDLFLGTLVGFILGATMISGISSQWHMNRVFEERVKEHGCKIQDTWVNGEKRTGDLCIEPNGTIIRK